ncbi:Hypothetical protein CINCED_3A013662 [Cinara cedri]|uniref:Uncharacterized protein n=1 Tax=Cinara cedri TaxID=506608 RepID=A0A5E4N8M6_9HEMI|nr:Hypothetical protein CINCED_3A013662 [Cinara cedri]
MKRWLHLKRKNSDVDDEKTVYEKKKSTKLHKYDSNYLSMGFTCNGFEEEPKPQCVTVPDISRNWIQQPF